MMRYPIVRCVLVLFGVVTVTACNPIRMTTDAVGMTQKSVSAGEKLYVNMPPEQALKVLDEVAVQHGWSIVSVGDQYDMQGLRGKYYRLETTRFIGGRKEMSGVFFTESTGCYTVVGKTESGLPPELVDPFLAASGGRVGKVKTEEKASEEETEKKAETEAEKES